MKVTIEGEEIEITNWNEILQKIGFQLEKKIREKARDMRLVDSGRFIQSIYSEVGNEELYVGTGVFYGNYLEYGTLGYWQRYGLGNFPTKPDPKKKNMSESQKAGYPKGMQPFAPFRRVLYNKKIMTEVINNAFN